MKADAYTTTMTITPNRKTGCEWTEQYDWHVPTTVLQEPDRSIVDTVSANGRRLMREDSIRAAYQQHTFYKGQDETLRKARSNWKVIERFIKENHPHTALVLKGLNEKDLSDVTIDVLHDACLMNEEALKCGGVRIST